MVVTLSGTFRRQVINIRRIDNRIPSAREVAVALIVRNYEHNIGWIASKRTGSKESRYEQAQEKISNHCCRLFGFHVEWGTERRSGPILLCHLHIAILQEAIAVDQDEAKGFDFSWNCYADRLSIGGDCDRLLHAVNF